MTRPATVADVEAIARLHVEAWREAYRGVVPETYLDGLDWRERAEARRAQLADPTRAVRIWVAEEDDTVVGFVAWGPDRASGDTADDRLEVYALYVDPAVWGRGHGGALLRQVVSALPPAAALVLWVLEANERARSFYERHRFRADGALTTIEVGGVELPELRYRYGGPQGARPPDR